ncbi:hypothetical protein HY972_02210 [Candidatus Kaiserbacteria bacterium]|nr:hypothetical protein [Candidatus Kaiserbacteria bacterium]
MPKKGIDSPPPQKEMPFDPHSVPSAVSVQEQKNNKEIRKFFAEDGLIPPESVRDTDVDIDGIRVPQYATRPGMQTDMEVLNSPIKKEDSAVTSEPVADEILALNPSGRLEGESIVLGVDFLKSAEQRDLAKQLAHLAGYASEPTAQNAEHTPKDWREKLKTLIMGAKEKVGRMSERGERLKEYLADRLRGLQEKAKEYGQNIEKFIRDKGEEYNKLSFKKKLAIGIVLGTGAAAFSTVSTPLTIAFAINLGIQRFGGMASMFLKFEKHLQDTVEGKSKGLLGRQEWYQNIFMGSSERQRKVAALFMAATYTTGMSAAIGEAVKLASESSLGEAVHDWLKQQYPMSIGEVPPVLSPEETNEPSGNAAMSPETTPSTPVAATGAAFVAPTPQVEMPTVEATPGHGYEYMMKRMWEQLQERHLDPNQYPEGSDIRRLLGADATSIDKIVHQIAADPRHAFFRPDGASVRIDLDSQMTIGEHGELHLSNAAHDYTFAPAHASETPAYRPEASAVPESAIPSVETAPPEPVKLVDLTQGQNIVQPDVPPSYDSSVLHDSQGAVVLDSEGNPVHTGTYEAPSNINQFGLKVPVGEPHIYADPGAKHFFAYGGSSSARAQAISEYLMKTPNSVVFGADDAGRRIPWHLVEGKMTAGAPMRTNGFLGFFSDWMKPPDPNEFEKIIK